MKNRRSYEKKVVGLMIQLYCKRNHGGHAKDDSLCDECSRLFDYVARHVSHCRYGESKTFCANCPKPCYAPVMREQIRKVMRYAGPRMMLHHPVIALWHLLVSRFEVRRLRRGDELSL